jgi:NTP pyrophosphatase (non-canonical NTP hydrolase)
MDTINALKTAYEKMEAATREFENTDYKDSYESNISRCIASVYNSSTEISKFIYRDKEIQIEIRVYCRGEYDETVFWIIPYEETLSYELISAWNQKRMKDIAEANRVKEEAKNSKLVAEALLKRKELYEKLAEEFGPINPLKVSE